MLDIDKSGSITLKQLSKVMMGNAIRFFTCEFSHPDAGIDWAVDEERFVSIGHIEPHSIASKNPLLMDKLRIHKLNNMIIPPNGGSALNMVLRELIKLHDSPISVEFLEPIFSINVFNNMLGLVANRVLYALLLIVSIIFT